MRVKTAALALLASTLGIGASDARADTSFTWKTGDCGGVLRQRAVDGWVMPYLNGVCEREPYEVIVFILADGERYPDGVRWSSYPFRPTISFNFDLRGLRSVAKNASYRSCVQIVEFHGNWGLQFKNGASDFKLGKDYIGACTKSESYK